MNYAYEPRGVATIKMKLPLATEIMNYAYGLIGVAKINLKFISLTKILNYASCCSRKPRAEYRGVRIDAGGRADPCESREYSRTPFGNALAINEVFFPTPSGRIREAHFLWSSFLPLATLL
jgi:hypothetical protein